MIYAILFLGAVTLIWLVATNWKKAPAPTPNSQFVQAMVDAFLSDESFQVKEHPIWTKATVRIKGVLAEAKWGDGDAFFTYDGDENTVNSSEAKIIATAAQKRLDALYKEKRAGLNKDFANG